MTISKYSSEEYQTYYENVLENIAPGIVDKCKKIPSSTTIFLNDARKNDIALLVNDLRKIKHKYVNLYIDENIISKKLKLHFLNIVLKIQITIF